MGDFETVITKTSFVGKFMREKVSKIRNGVDAFVVLNLHEKYTNNTLKSSSCNDVLLENKLEIKMLFYLIFIMLFIKSSGVRSFLAPL